MIDPPGLTNEQSQRGRTALGPLVAAGLGALGLVALVSLPQPQQQGRLPRITAAGDCDKQDVNGDTDIGGRGCIGGAALSNNITEGSACSVPGLPLTMQAILAQGPSPLGVTRGIWNIYWTENAPLPPCPYEDEIQVQVRGSSVNPADWYEAQTRGAAQAFDHDPGLGDDLSGVVVAVGRACAAQGFRVGDEVWGVTASATGDFRSREQNAYAQFANAFCNLMGKRSPAAPVSLEDLGTVGLAGGTSIGALLDAGAPWSPEDNVTVAIASGSGGTGTFAIQGALGLGAARVFAAASPAHFAMIRSLGATPVDYHTTSLWEALPTSSVDLVWDNLGAAGTAQAAARVLKRGGLYLTLAVGHFATWQAAGTGIGTPALPADGVLVVDGKPIVARSPSVREEATDSVRIVAIMNRLIDAGLLRPVVGERYPLRRVAAALDASVNGHAAGKIAIHVPPVDGWSMQDVLDGGEAR